MSDDLKRLEPRPLWEHFAALTHIPRPSKAEARAVDYVRSVASARNLSVRRDAIGNVVVEVPGTRGRESAPVLILQSHLDMVCEKNRDVVHDFDRDPIRTRIDGEWVRATGTTLGADNGIGVAAALAFATDTAAEHGPLELLFTIDEETGLTGANQLDPSILRGTTLLNLDSEEDGALYVGCAGGADSRLRLTVEREHPPAGSSAYRLEVAGLRGGHSGGDIHLNRANALKVLARVLWAARSAECDFALSTLAGGSKHNAIPREAEAVLWLSAASAKSLEGIVACMLEGLRNEYARIDDGLTIQLAAGDGPATVLTRADRDRFLALLTALPHGVQAMSTVLDDLVETSNNLAVVRAEGDDLLVVTSSRSSVRSSIQGLLQSIAATGTLARAQLTVSDGYPGWKPNLASPVLGLARDVYREHWKREPKVAAIHAGLECGLLGEKVPGLDMVSLGPQIEGAHSPDERVNIPSVQRFWTALQEIVQKFGTTK